MTAFIASRPLRITIAGTMSLDAEASYEEGSATTTTFTLSGPTTGTTGVASTFTVTPDGTMASTVVVTPAASNAGSIAPTSLTFAIGTSSAQTFTVTRATDGTSSVSITNNGGISNLGTPIALATSGSSSLGLDFQLRRSPPSVTFWTDFNQSTDFVTAATNGGHVVAAGMNPVILARVTKDSTDGLAAGVCLKIETPADAGANSAEWMFPFSRIYTSNASNIGNEIWIQFRLKIPPERLTLSNCGGAQRGWKLLNLAQYSIEDTDSQSFSNTTAEHVLQDTNQRGLLQAYHRDSAGSFPPFEGFAGGQITLQTAIDRGAAFSGGDRYCHYPDGTPACEFWVTDEWMTIMVHIITNTFNGSTGNLFEAFYANRGDTEWTQTHRDTNYSLGSPNSNGGGFTHINGGHFLTYETNRLATATGNVASHQKYAELIVSKNRIALPRETPSALALQAASMTAGQWAQMASTPSGLSSFVDAAGAFSNIKTGFATKMAYDPIGRKIYFIGCDHGRPQSFLQYDEATNAWTELTATPFGSATKHGYEHTAWDDVHHKLWHRPYQELGVRRWDGGGTWTSVSYASSLGYASAANAICWFPNIGDNGRIIVFQLESGVNGEIIGIDPVTSAQTTYAPPPTLANTGDPHNFAHYSPVHKRVWFGGGDSAGTTTWTLDSAGAVTSHSGTGATPGALGDIGPGGLGDCLPVCSPANGNFLVFKSSSVWYEFNPIANTWTVQSGTASAFSAPNHSSSGPAFGVVAVPLHEYGVIVFMKAVNLTTTPQMWLYKP